MGQWDVDASGRDVWVPTSFAGKLVGTIVASFVVGIVTFGAYLVIEGELFKRNADAQVAFTLSMDGDDAVLADVRVEKGDYHIGSSECTDTVCTIQLHALDTSKNVAITLRARASACAPCVDAAVRAFEGRTVQMRSFSGYGDQRFRGRYFLKLNDPDPGSSAEPSKATVVACR